MYNDTKPLIYGAQRAYPVQFRGIHELTIFEAAATPPASNPLAAPLARQRAAYRTLQYNVYRGLWIGLTILFLTALRAIFHSHDWLLILPLWVLTSTCVPLLVLASQGFTEVR